MNDDREDADVRLDHEKLDVYRVALELRLAALECVPRKGCRALRDQLERASTSVILNIAEGAGRTSSADKKRIYEIAKGSAAECAAILDVLRLSGRSSPPAHAHARALVIRAVQMLTRLSSGPR
jgi:four helix bundle protein